MQNAKAEQSGLNGYSKSTLNYRKLRQVKVNTRISNLATANKNQRSR